MYLEEIEIVNPEDKGISGGEESHLICKNLKISGGEIAIVSKDNSIIEIQGVTINSSKLGYCAFQKKSEYGPGIIVANNATSKNLKTEYLIEIGSTLSINGIEVKNKSPMVKKLLYGTEYGKLSK